MNKRMIAVGTGGLLVGAGLVAVPSLALASRQTPTPTPTASSSEMGQMMTDEEFRQQMKDAMSDMMSDPELQEQMRSMMSDAMGGMEGGESGDMPGMDMGS